MGIGDASRDMMPKYPKYLSQFCRPVLEHYELKDEMGRMFVRSMSRSSVDLLAVVEALS